MPTKSNNMSPMPMQPKIGEASLKFGPDWLRALSSSETTGGNGNNVNTSPGGETGGPRGFGFSGWGGGGTGDGRGFSNSKDYPASSHFSPNYHHQQSYQSSSVREGKGGTPPGTTSLATRFKPSEHRYSREEMLALYDKNLDAPSFLLNFGALIIDKMQPPLAFSQPAEDEIRIWHSPQPESSRQGSAAAPAGRGFAIRGRGSGIERGRGRGRGGYYGRPPHEEDDRVGGPIPRPRTFDRSQSNHERIAWGERNGIGSGGGPPGVDVESTRGGGNWRNRESFGGRRHDENDDGWRKPRWRRGEEEGEDGSGQRGSSSNSSGSRRLHRSWSEDDNHDNIPEWAKDNPSEESGTFDSSGAFHGEDRIRNRSDLDRKSENENSLGIKPRVAAESEPSSGSQNDKIQKRNPDRNDSVNKPVIPTSVREEPEEPHLDQKIDSTKIDHLSSDKHSLSSSMQHHQIINSIKQDKSEDKLGGINMNDSRQHQQIQHGLGHPQYENQMHQHQKITSVQHQISSHETRNIQQMNLQSVDEQRNNLMHLHQQQQLQQSRMEMRASNSNTHESNSIGGVLHNRHGDEDRDRDPYRSMTEEAFNLVSKLIEEEGNISSRLGSVVGAPMRGGPIPSHQQILQSGVNPSTANLSNNVAAMNLNDLSRSSGGPTASNIPLASSVPVIPPSPVSPSSPDIWFYRDPQGSVQGPFNTQEMGLWYSQGYFSGKLFLRRECDKMFITLAEMGKLYGRNPFVPIPDSPIPPPIQDPNTSALDFPRGDCNQIQAQLQQRQQQQLLQQQNILREQQQTQYMMNIGQNSISKEESGSGWQQGSHNIPHVPQVQHGRHTPNAPITSEQIQAQILIMAKSQAMGERDPNMVDQLHAMLQRQLKNSSGDSLMSQQQSNNQKNEYGDMIPPHRHSAPMEISKSPTPATNPLQSIVQQLTNSMANTQQHLRMNTSVPTGSKSADVINPWGQVNPAVVQPSIPNQWGIHANPNAPAPWEYREQMALNQKIQHEEELRRRKDEAEEAERKRLEEDEQKRVEDQQRLERKRMEEQRHDEEKQRKNREEQYLLQKQQQELLKQQEEAEITRQKEIIRQKEIQHQRQVEQRQQLEQQRQLRDEQTRLAEEQQQELQKLEHQRTEKERSERKEKEQAERELKLRQERERQERAEQAKFSWNSVPQQPVLITSNKSLLEIQQEESVQQEKEAHLKKKQQQQDKLVQQQKQQDAQQQKSINLKWAQSAAPVKAPPIKSLTEIQAEEQAKLHKQQEKEREKRATVQHQMNQQQAWSAQLTWANRASTTAVAAAGSKSNGGGVWDREEPSSMAAKLKSSSSNNQSSNNRAMQQPSSTPVGKRTKEMSEDSFMKLFNVGGQQESGGSPSAPTNKGNRGGKQQSHSSPGGGPQDEFTRWCFEKVQLIGGSVDIPTFVGFLKEVESPYEVGDYVRSYLGDGKEAREFSREFLERRSRWKNARKDGKEGSFEDNLCRPASAVNPNSNDFQEVKTKGKKPKKGKMQKVDSRILGFSTSAATDRLNVGNRDYGDSTE